MKRILIFGVTCVLTFLCGCGGGAPSPEPREDGLYVTARPRITPDGRRLLFAAVRENRSRIYSAFLDGRSVRLFRAEPQADLHSPAHSFDGLKVAFVQSRPGEARGTVGIVGSEGGEAIFLNPPAGAFDRMPAFTPDGRQVVFQRSYKLDLMQEFFIADAEGGDARLLREDVAWRPHLHGITPDGEKVLFAQMEEIVWKNQKSYRYQIATIDIGAGTLERLDPPGRSRPCLSRDGTILAFVGDGGKGNVIYTATPDGKGLKEIYGSYRGIESLSFGPKGRRLVFLEQADRYSRRYRIMLVDLKRPGPAREAPLDWQSLPPSRPE